MKIIEIKTIKLLLWMFLLFILKKHCLTTTHQTTLLIVQSNCIIYLRWVHKFLIHLSLIKKLFWYIWKVWVRIYIFTVVLYTIFFSFFFHIFILDIMILIYFFPKIHYLISFDIMILYFSIMLYLMI